MSTTEHARALYEDAAEATNGQTLETLAAELERRARQIRGEQVAEGLRENAQEVRDDVAEVLAQTQPQEREEVADQLEETAETLRKVFGKAAPTVQKLPGDTAAEAKLASTEMHVDPLKIARGEREIVDEEIAEDIYYHELEHNHQSEQSDTEAITIGIATWKDDEVREIAAVSVQKRVDFLSATYRRFALVTMDEQDRALVRAGRFKALEAKKNGIALAA